MTDFELAYRLAEIKKAKHPFSDSLRIDLMLDLYDSGLSVENIWKLLNNT